LKVNRPEPGATANKISKIRWRKSGHGLMLIIFGVRGGKIRIAEILMPAGGDALFGPEIVATDEIVADAAHPIGTEDQIGFVSGRSSVIDRLAEIAKFDVGAVEQIEIYAESRAMPPLVSISNRSFSRTTLGACTNSCMRWRG